MPPNRRAVSCPDLFALDESHGWLANACSTNDDVSLPPPNVMDEAIDYWGWHMEHDEKLVQCHQEDDRIETHVYDKSRNCQDKSKREPVPRGATDELSKTHHYWTWVHWRNNEKDRPEVNDPPSPSSYWHWHGGVPEHHAVKHIYKTGMQHMIAQPIEISHHDYWHGM
jgi:hypothetical protein